MLSIGFIDHYLDEWHANNYPAMLCKESGGEMRVTHAFAEIDSPKGGLTTDAWCAKFGVKRCGSIAELIDACDALIVLSPDNCERHWELCQLPLRSGKPTYVDKTFAPDGETAAKLLAIAEESGTPCYSTSALRYAAEYQDIDRSAIRAVSTWGPFDFETYAIHQLEPILMLMNAPATRVLALTNDRFMSLAIAFADGRTATLSCFGDDGPFATRLAMDGGSKQLAIESDYFGAFIRELARFLRERTPRVPHDDTRRIMAVRGAGLRALARPGEWTEVDQL